MARWRSQAVSLAIIGVAGLAACEKEPDSYYRRNVYGSRGDCYRDYGPRTCEPYSGGGAYYGPWFYSGSGRGQAPVGDPGPGATAVNGRSTVAGVVTAPVRGGFGASGRSSVGHGHGG